MKGWKRKLGLLYLLLLLGSWSWVAVRPSKVPPPRWYSTTVQAGGNSPAQLRYRRVGTAHPGKKPVLLIHGSPMDSVSFNALLKCLPPDREYIVPDLPGFGWSSAQFTDYSFRSNAEVLRQLLDSCHLDSVHVVAYSLGGGSVLEFLDVHPERFASLTMLSSIGVQDYELTGDYLLNHLLHGLQYGVLEFLRWGLPHFGWLDDFLLNTRYAQSFLQSDMRPLRGVLERIQLPTLILHGEEDFLIPPIAAREHRRLVPQSESVWFKGGHGFLFSQPAETASALVGFWEKVDAGGGVWRTQASPERVAAAAVPFDQLARMELSGNSLRVVLSAIALATLLSEDLACIVAGLLAARGLIGIPEAVASALIGILVGDVMLYFLGRWGVGRLQKLFFRKFMSEKTMDVGRKWLARDGWKAVLGSRFVPGARLPMYLAAGAVGAPFPKMLLWFVIAAILWTIPVVTLLAIFSIQMSNFLMSSGTWLLPLALASTVFLWFLLRLFPLLFAHRGRRILLGKWFRLTRWEFWPIPLVYSVVTVAVIWMGLRRGCLTFFTAANPTFPHGGLIGESKSAILSPLEKSGAVARFTTVMGHSQQDALFAWQQTLVSAWPLVIKPDVGERGSGVVIVRDRAALIAELEERTSLTIVQEYVEGSEFGVFYVRQPGADQGFIFSVTIKHMTSVTGDGERTLEDLILDDDRAVCSEKLFRERFLTRLNEIPAKDERFVLTEIGSHCRGALFENGEHLITPALEKEMERIARCLPGFNFGRFDLRCANAEALREGRGLRILELNGVSSEATHIYHPGSSLFVGWKTLIEQWRLAIEIGRSNVKSGAKVSSVGSLWRLFLTR